MNAKAEHYDVIRKPIITEKATMASPMYLSNVPFLDSKTLVISVRYSFIRFTIFSGSSTSVNDEKLWQVKKELNL